MTRSQFDALERAPHGPDRPGEYAAVVDGEVLTLTALQDSDGEIGWLWHDMPDGYRETVWTASWPCARVEPPA